MRKLGGWRRSGFAVVVGLAACSGRVSQRPSDGAGAQAGAASGHPSGSFEGGAPNGSEAETPGAGGTKAGSAGKGGKGGRPSSAGSGGAGVGGINGSGCLGNQIKLDGVCTCPPYAPKFCVAVSKCVSPEKDPEHCGDCDNACGPRNACAAGDCTPDLTLIAELPGCGTLVLEREPGQLAPGVIYALGSKSGTLSKIELPEAGDGKPKTIASGLPGASALLLLSDAALVAAGKRLSIVDLTTGVKTLLVSESTTIYDLAVNAGLGDFYYAAGKSIKRFSPGVPGTETVVAVAADEGEPQGLTSSRDTLLYVSNLAFNVESQDLGSSLHVKIAASQGQLIFGHRSIQADDTSVYWANGALLRQLLGSDEPASTVAQPIDGSPVVAYAVDPIEMMSYIGTMDGRFEKASFDSQEEATWVARNLPAITSIVLDETDVYLASDCKIFRSRR